MLRLFGIVFRLPARAWKAARRHPRLTLLLAVVLAAGTGLSLWGYAAYQWRAARIALEEDRPAEARDRLRFCLTLWPRSAEVHLLAARAARLTNDLEAAEAHLNRCLRLQDGATEEVQLEFLLMRVQSGEVDEVAPALIDAVQKGHPESPLILETMARAYILRLRYGQALDCMSRWVEIRPDDAKAYQWRGWVLERLNHHKAAREDYYKALELDPELAPVRLRVAEMLMEDKQAPEALPHLERLYRRMPDNPIVLARLGMCRSLQGDPAARELMERAVIKLPDDPALLVNLARLDLEKERWAKAEQRLRRVLEKDPADTEARYVLISALQGQGRTKEAVAAREDYERYKALVDRTNDLLQEEAKSLTGRADLASELGALLLEIGRESLGEYWLNKALDRDPTHQPAHRALAEHYERKGDARMAAVHRSRLREPYKTEKIVKP